MNLLVKNKIVSVGGSSYVKDENGNNVFDVRGKIFSFTRKKQIFDANGQFLYTVKNRFFQFFFHKAYIYDANNNKIATVSTKFSIHEDYSIKGFDKPVNIDGSILGFNYKIYFGSDLVAVVSRKLFALSDTFNVEVLNDNDAPFVVALIIAIDNIHDEKRAENSTSTTISH